MASPLVSKYSNSSLGSYAGEHLVKNHVNISERQQTVKGNTVEETEQSDLPVNFGEVVDGIFRSSFPRPWNLGALGKLRLKTIITFVEEQYSNVHISFLLKHGIAHRRIVIKANKDPKVFTPESTIIRVLDMLLDRDNHPVLIHCNKGKHRTGCIVGCFRKIQGWPMHEILAEYRGYSHPKSRALDEKFIMSFDATKLKERAEAAGVALWKPSNNFTLLAMPDKEADSDNGRVHSSLGEVSVPSVI